MNRAVTRYCPPPSGKTMVYRPFSLECVCRDISVSSETASMSAPSIGWPVGSVMVPVRMSVVVPTCAAASGGLAESAAVTSATTSVAVRHRKFVHPGWTVVTTGRVSGCGGECGLDGP